MTGHIERAIATAAAVLLLSTGPAAAQTHGGPEEFSAFAINMGALTGGTGATAQLLMRVNRWSTDAERDALFTTLREKGADALLQELSRTRSVGSLRTPTSIGYDIRLSMQEPGKDGGRRVLLVTDRPVGFGEATSRPRSMDYPFTVIDMQIPAEGYGQGTMSIAAKIIPAGKTILVENYDTQPVQLNRIETRSLAKK
jgi:hypothetical protein